MYKKFFKCEYCHKKGAYVIFYYLGNVPPFAWLKCRYCKKTWETNKIPPPMVSILDKQNCICYADYMVKIVKQVQIINPEGKIPSLDHTT